MGYMKQGSKKALELASKINHSHIINDPEVAYFLKNCEDIPREIGENDFKEKGIVVDVKEPLDNPIKYIVAVDGGYSEIEVNKRFPASRLAYFQFGALFFDLESLENMEAKPFLFPEDMQKFKELNRIKLILPTKYISYKCNSLLDSVRQTIFEFFKKDRGGETFIDTLEWFLFQGYKSEGRKELYTLASCPNPDCNERRITIRQADLRDYMTDCPSCKNQIYLTDTFRLHEAVDEEMGAGGVLGYLTTLIEQFIIIHAIKYLLKKRPKSLEEFLFIKDGPLAYFGQTANMHKPMRELCNYLQKHHDLFLVGLEKSGAFVEHADLICSSLVDNEKPMLENGKVLLLSNEYIYSYVMPGIPNDEKPYASTSYYSSKLIYHTDTRDVYVATIPVEDEKVVLDPKKASFHNMDTILSNVAKLRCDMYENSLVPIALINQLVSLANHPSSVLLEKFSKAGIKKQGS